VNADKFLDTVPPIPVLFPDVETRESQDDHADETAVTQLSMALKHPVLESECELSLTPDRAPEKPQIECSLERMSLPTAIDVGIQCDDSSVVTMLIDPQSTWCPENVLVVADLVCHPQTSFHVQFSLH